MKMNRRSFVKTAAQATAALATAPRLVASTGTASREPLRQFDYAAVQLTGGPFAAQYDALRAHYLALSNDRLLKVYRQRAGLPAPGRDMGGWYDLDGFVPGHTLGQYISGLARFGASTGDAACHQKVHDLVDGFAATLGSDNQSILRPQTNLWICYTLDKHFAGLIDAATLSKMPSARDLLSRVLAGAQPLLPARGRDRIGKKDLPYDETYVMPENLYTAAALHRQRRFSDLAGGICSTASFSIRSPTVRIPSPASTLTRTPSPCRPARRRGWCLATIRTNTPSRTPSTCSPRSSSLPRVAGDRTRRSSRPTAANSIARSPAPSTTSKRRVARTRPPSLARYLIRFTPAPTDTAHPDYLERVLFNTILAVRPPDDDGDYPYYSTYSPVAQKVYYAKKWPCCSGTLAQTVADYPLNLYFHADDGLYVNLYAPSRLRFIHAGTRVDLTQETRYPAEDTTTLILHPASPANFSVYLRIPAWIAQSATVKLNGKPLPVPARPGTYAAIHRTWRAGDRLDLTLPQSFRTEAIDDLHPETVALMRGPVQYVAVSPTAELSSERLTLPAGLKQTGPQSFVENYSGNDINFVPLHQIQNDTYTTYFSKA